MAYTLTLTKTVTPTLDGTASPGVTITYTITAVTGFLDRGLFLKQGGVSQSVCRPADLLTYNMATPTPPTNFVRAVNFTFFQPVVQDALDTAASIEASLRQLIQDMELLALNTSSTISMP